MAPPAAAAGTRLFRATCTDKSAALQYTYGADVSRHRRHPEHRRALGKSVVLRGREQYLPGVVAGRRI